LPSRTLSIADNASGVLISASAHKAAVATCLFFLERQFANGFSIL
jgi:hypothetical protein